MRQLDTSNYINTILIAVGALIKEVMLEWEKILETVGYELLVGLFMKGAEGTYHKVRLQNLCGSPGSQELLLRLNCHLGLGAILRMKYSTNGSGLTIKNNTSPWAGILSLKSKSKGEVMEWLALMAVVLFFVGMIRFADWTGSDG